MRTRQHRQTREGGFLAEVPVALVEDDTAWSPFLTPEDMRKRDMARLALSRGDIPAARDGENFMA